MRRTDQHVDGERHDHERHQEVGQRQADDEVIGDGLQGAFAAHADYDQHVAEQGEYGEHDQSESPIVFHDQFLVATGAVVVHPRRRQRERDGRQAAVARDCRVRVLVPGGGEVSTAARVLVVVVAAAGGAVADVHHRHGHRRSGRGRCPVRKQLDRGGRAADARHVDDGRETPDGRGARSGAGRATAVIAPRESRAARAEIPVRPNNNGDTIWKKKKPPEPKYFLFIYFEKHSRT